MNNDIIREYLDGLISQLEIDCCIYKYNEAHLSYRHKGDYLDLNSISKIGEKLDTFSANSKWRLKQMFRHDFNDYEYIFHNENLEENIRSFYLKKLGED